MNRSPLFRLAVCDHRIAIRPTNPIEHSHEAAWKIARRLVPENGPGVTCAKCLEQRHVAKYWGTVTRSQEKREADGGVFEEAQFKKRRQVKAANPLNLTDVQKRTLRAMRACDAGPAHLSCLVWPGHIALRRGAAPGTGLVRPMLAILARLKNAGLVEWYSRDGEPVVWTLTTRGMDAIYMPMGERVAHLKRRFI